MQRWPTSIALFLEKYTSNSSNMACQKIIHSSIQVVVPTRDFYSMCTKKALLIVMATLLTTHQKLLAIQQSFNQINLTIFGSKMWLNI